jgi:CheY-like chemotaxis protein
MMILVTTHCAIGVRAISDQVRDFGDVAQKLAKNPLGIIALFIVLVYGVAALVTGFGSSLSNTERVPLVYFLVLFPVLVLFVFGWLVSKHANKLFGPGDFRNEENYVRILTATASLAVATAKNDDNVSAADLSAVVSTVRRTSLSDEFDSTSSWKTHVLWVDDRPGNNVNERRALEAMGLHFTLVLSTQAAVEKLGQSIFAAIISDMERREGAREGYVLLDEIRSRGIQTPFFIYASSDAPEHQRETIEHGGQGTTNRPETLFQMVMRAVVSA